jgi:hypothetical protein
VPHDAADRNTRAPGSARGCTRCRAMQRTPLTASSYGGVRRIRRRAADPRGVRVQRRPTAGAPGRPRARPGPDLARG